MSLAAARPPCALFGGGYPLVPGWLIRRGFEALHRQGPPGVVYLHPRDLAGQSGRADVVLPAVQVLLRACSTTASKLRMLPGRYAFARAARRFVAPSGRTWPHDRRAHHHEGRGGESASPRRPQWVGPEGVRRRFRVHQTALGRSRRRRGASSSSTSGPATRPRRTGARWTTCRSRPTGCSSSMPRTRSSRRAAARSRLGLGNGDSSDAGYYLNRLFMFLGSLDPPLRVLPELEPPTLPSRRRSLREPSARAHGARRGGGVPRRADDPGRPSGHRTLDREAQRLLAARGGGDRQASRVAPSSCRGPRIGLLFGNACPSPLVRAKGSPPALPLGVPLPLHVRLETRIPRWARGCPFSFISAYEFLISRRSARSASARFKPVLDRNPEATLDVPVTVSPVLNEERNSACLSRLQRFAKVIVVDLGSSDRTREIAREHGVEVVDFVERPVPSTAATGCRTTSSRRVDPLPRRRRVRLRRLLRRAGPGPSGIEPRRHVADLPQPLHGRYPKHGEVHEAGPHLARASSREYVHERIDEERWSHSDMEVHEHLVLAGTTGRIDAPIDHDDYKGSTPTSASTTSTRRGRPGGT